MLCESRHENLKILIAPLKLRLTSSKPTTVVLGFINLYFKTKINDHIL